MGAEEGGGRFPPPAAAAIAISSIAVSSIVTNLSTDHVPAIAVVQRCCVCPLITVIAALADTRMWPRRCRNNGPPPDDMAINVIVGVALVEAAAAALSSFHPLHPIASFTC